MTPGPSYGSFIEWLPAPFKSKRTPTRRNKRNVSRAKRTAAKAARKRNR